MLIARATSNMTNKLKRVHHLWLLLCCRISCLFVSFSLFFIWYFAFLEWEKFWRWVDLVSLPISSWTKIRKKFKVAYASSHSTGRNSALAMLEVQYHVYYRSTLRLPLELYGTRRKKRLLQDACHQRKNRGTSKGNSQEYNEWTKEERHWLILTFFLRLNVK